MELQRQLSGGLRLDWQHDAVGRLVSPRLRRGSQVEHQRRYQWQATEQLAELADSQQGTTACTYDAAGKLAGAT